MGPLLSSESRLRLWRLRDHPLAVQFWAAGAIVVIAFGASLWILLSLLASQADSTRMLMRSHSTVNRLNELSRGVFLQQASAYDFIQTHQESFFRSVREGRKLWNEEISGLLSLLASNPSDTEQLIELNHAYEKWRKRADELIGWTQKSPGEELPQALRSSEQSAFREMLREVDRMVEKQNELSVSRNESARESERKTYLRILALDLLLLLFFSYVLRRLYLNVSRPVKTLMTTMERYEGGDFGARAPFLGSERNEVSALSRHFNGMAEKIEGMVADLRRLDELKNEFVSTVSHELKSPLTSISGYTKLLLNGDAGPLNDTQKEFLGIVNSNVSRLSDLISDILDIEKMDAGRVKLTRAPVDLVPLLRECVTSLAPIAFQKGLQIRAEIPPAEIVVFGDRARLGQIFLNLLSNAVKYTQKGTVALEVDLQPYAVRVHVKDTGIGMTDEEREKLFQRFYRTPSAQMTGEGGTGLGLAIARALVEGHGGQIQVESAPGKGSDFVVSLPLGGRESPSREGGAIRRKVLLADRDPGFRKQIRQALEARGFQVDEAERGQQVLGRLEEESYELALLDLSLPDLSGEKLVRAARARISRGKAMLIFATLDEQQAPPTRDQLLRIGADRYTGRHFGIGGVVDSILRHFEEGTS